MCVSRSAQMFVGSRAQDRQPLVEVPEMPEHLEKKMKEVDSEYPTDADCAQAEFLKASQGWCN